MSRFFGFRRIKIESAAFSSDEWTLSSGIMWFIYPCSPCTSCNKRTGISTSAQVRWSSSTSIFSSPADLSPPSHWCRMNDERLKIKATFHSPILFYFSPQISQTGVWIKCRQVCVSVVYMSAQSPKQKDFARTARWQSYGHCPLWVMILWGGANGRIDSVTSADAY